MSKRNTSWGRMVAVVAAAGVLTLTGCDPYIGANNAAPLVIGAAVVDVTGATSAGFAVPPFGYDYPPIPDLDNGCYAPYPEPDQAWADATYPGLCVPQNAVDFLPTVCPVSCFPPRTGPAYAPLYSGDLGGSYQASGPGNTTVNIPYALPADGKYRVLHVPPDYEPLNDELFSQIVVLFNKVMDPKSIQPDPIDCTPPALVPGSTLPRVEAVSPANSTATPVDVTDQFTICYNPSSSAQFWGASIQVTPTQLNADDLPILNADTRYRVFGKVYDQSGNAVDVDVTVITDPATAPAALRKR